MMNSSSYNVSWAIGLYNKVIGGFPIIVNRCVMSWKDDQAKSTRCHPGGFLFPRGTISRGSSSPVQLQGESFCGQYDGHVLQIASNLPQRAVSLH